MRDRRTAPTPVLELDSVEVSYGNVLALEGVSLRVDAGELVCLLGGNASGKTTTMKTIVGFVRPQRGQIRLRGEDVTGASPDGMVRRGVAMVPENRELFPHMTVIENLVLGAFTRHDRASVSADLDRVLDLFPRLAERRRQQAGTLSGGEQQMVAVGRALMAGPHLLLMDEPSMGLSPALVKQSFKLIERIHAEGMTVLLVEQNARLSLGIADRGYVLQAGRIVLAGPAAELSDNEALRRAYLG